MESESHASRIVSAIKIYDTLERSALKIHRRVFVSCSRAKGCNFCGLLTFCSENYREKLSWLNALLRRSMRNNTSCRKTRESPGCFSSLIGQKNFRSRQFKWATVLAKTVAPKFSHALRLFAPIIIFSHIMA